MYQSPSWSLEWLPCMLYDMARLQSKSLQHKIMTETFDDVTTTFCSHDIRLTVRNLAKYNQTVKPRKQKNTERSGKFTFNQLLSTRRELKIMRFVEL
jgi:hypothetical protein